METDWSSEQRDYLAELETLDREQKRRDTEPLLLCKLITRWPLQAFLLTLFAHLSMIVTTGLLYMSGYDILPLYLEYLPLRLVDEPWDARLFAWTDRIKYDGYYTRGGSSPEFRTSVNWYSTVDLYYENSNGGNIFTRSTLSKMKQLEDELMAAKDYDKFCKLDIETRLCIKPVSILRYFDGTFSAIDPIFNDEHFDNIAAVLLEAFINNATRDTFKFFLAKGYNVTHNEMISPLTRSQLSFGAPHEEFSISEYEKESEIYSGETIQPVLERYEYVNEFKLSYSSEAIWRHNGKMQAMNDSLWTGASMAFIFFIILLHTRSLWISGFAVFSVFASFFTGNLIYNLVLRFEYIGYFNMLSVFIILGIGADDFFVFYDVWRNTASDEYLSIAHRLSDSYKRSVFSMLFTSLTTAVAFLSSAITPLLATRSFGVFSAIVVLMNYVSVVLFFPTVVMMYHVYFEDSTWPCCYPCTKRRNSSHQRRDTNNKSTKSNDESDAVMSETTYNISSDAKINPTYGAGESAGLANHWSSYFNDLTLKLEIPKVSYKSRFSDRHVYYHNGDFKQYEKSKTADKSIQDREIRNCPVNTMFYGDRNLYMHGSAEPSQKKKGRHQSETCTTNTNLQSNNFIGLKNNPMPCQAIPQIRVSASNRYRKNLKKKSMFVRFFRNYYFRFVTNKYARWVILLALIGVWTFFSYEASMIESGTELFNIFPDDHPFATAYKYKLNAFVTSFGQGDSLLSVHLMFGVKPNDITVCHFSDPVCTGRQGWDPDFNPNTVEAQTMLMDLCKTLRTLPDTEADELHIQRNPNTGEYNVKCFMDNLQSFLQEESHRTGADWSLPFTREKMLNFIAARPEFYNISVFTPDFNNYLEIPISYWLSNGYSGNYTEDFYTFDQLIGEEIGPFSTKVKTNSDNMYGNNLKFVGISVGTTVQAMLLGYEEGRPIMENWEQFLNKQLAKMPDGLKIGFQISSHERWGWITKQKLLVQNAIYGIVIGLSLACPVLIIATGNVITGLLATLSLCCCTTCVVGVIVLGGWKLGMLEALNMCMIVGLAMDYVVHLAEGYTLSLHHDRLSRVRDMLDLMAVSVCFGAFTTLGASTFMLFTVLTFFSQFATFLFSTITFSLLFSMGLFTTLLGIVGPEGDTGNFVAIFQSLCSWKNHHQGSTKRVGRRGFGRTNVPVSARGPTN